MSITWTLAEIRAKVRKLCQRQDTADLSDSDINDLINDFYRNQFPTDVYAAKIKGWYSFDTASGDGGEYTLGETVITISTPLTVTDSDDYVSNATLYLNKDKFFELYPADSTDETAEENQPAAFLLYNNILYAAPKADAVYTVKMAADLKPAALSSDSLVPLDVRWGPAIAYGTAILIRMDNNETDEAKELVPTYQWHIQQINRPLLKQISQARAVPRF